MVSQDMLDSVDFMVARPVSAGFTGISSLLTLAFESSCRLNAFGPNDGFEMNWSTWSGRL
jgi:hypothetical protein